MANETVTITLTARDGSSQVFKTVGRNAQDMGKSVDEAGKKSSNSLESLNKNAVAVGVGVGALAGGLALAGQAALNQEQNMRALERSYGESTDQIVAMTEAIQDNTTFSNEQASAAAQTAATLARNYGFTADEIEELIRISADLAAVTGISLEDATQRTVAAMRGEAESAEALGLTLNQAAIDHEGLTLTMSQEEAAHFRLNALRDQSAFAAGAAGDAAETTSGQIKQLTNEVQDQIVRFGEWTGVTGQALATLSQFAPALPAVGAGIGALSRALPAAGSGIATLAGALGPVGLAAAAIAAGGAILYFSGVLDNDFVPSAESARDELEALIDTADYFAQQQSVIAPLAQHTADTIEYITNATSNYEQTQHDANDAIEEAEYWLGAAQNGFNTSGKSAEYWQAQLDSATKILADLNAEAASYAITADDLAAANDAANKVLRDTGPAGDLARDVLQKLYEQQQAGTILWPEYIARIIDLGEQLPIMTKNMVDSTKAVDDNTRAVNDNNEAYGNYVGIHNEIFAQPDLRERLRGEAEAYTAQQDAVDASGASLAAYVGSVSEANVAAAESTDTVNTMTAAVVDATNSHFAGEAAIRAELGAYYALIDGIDSASEAHLAFQATQDNLVASQQPYTQQLSTYNTQYGYIADALDLIQEKQEAGIALSKEEQQVLDGAASAQERLSGGTDDATIALALQAEQYAENMKIGDEMNDKLATQTEMTSALNDTINNLIAALHGIPGYVSTTIDVDAEDAKLQAQHIKDQLDALNGRTSYASVIITGYYTGPNVGYTMPGGKLGGVIPEGNRIGHAQHGASMRGWSWVGEAGPELIHAPGARVLPHTASVAATRGSAGMAFTNYGHITVRADDPEQFMQQMRAYTYAGER